MCITFNTRFEGCFQVILCSIQRLLPVCIFVFFRACLSVWLLDVQRSFRRLLLLLLFYSLEVADVHHLPYTLGKLLPNDPFARRSNCCIM